MGQEVSSYIEQIGINHVNSKKDVDKGKVNEEDDKEDEEGKEEKKWRTSPYIHYRTSIGSPAIARRSFTEEEIERFQRENDGFPLPCTEEELKEFDQNVFLEQTAVLTEPESPSKKSERQRSKSTTAIPDVSSLKSRFQKLHVQAPAKPKFLEYLINRVVSKKTGRSLRNGIINSEEDPGAEGTEEKLSPDSEKCLAEAETIIEEILSSNTQRPASGESTDSGKGSLLDTTSDFSPTPKRVSWSTPNSPTFHGIVKQRLRNFQALLECRESGSSEAGPSDSSPPSSPRSKTFQRSDSATSSQTERISMIMSKGYVRSLVQMINHHHSLDIDKESPDNEDTHSESVENSQGGNAVPESDTLTNGATDDAEGGDNGDPSGAQAAPLSTNSDLKNHEEEGESKDKLQWIAEELLSTEKIYVSRLHLLDQVFYFKLTLENKSGNFVPQDVIEQIFCNIKPIYQFHSKFLLPQLQGRIDNWSSSRKIGDLMKQNAPFLKLYSEYVKGFDHAMELINIWTDKCPRFAAVIQEIQQTPECGQLSLQHHMLEPIQRVPRYELFMKDYLKHLAHDAADRQDAQSAQLLVTEAASHSNTVLKKIEKFHKLLVIIQSLNGDGLEDLVIPTRELIKEGRITKISARSGEKQDRYLFLFNDLLLVCSEQMLGSYKLRARLSVDGMEVLPGDNLVLQNTFCIKCTEKTVEFLDDSNNGTGLDWLANFEKVIADYRSKPKVNKSVSESDTPDSPKDIEMDPDHVGERAPTWLKDDSVTMCMKCTAVFSAMKRRHHCRACGKIFCSKCSSYKVPLKYLNNEVGKVCETCHKILDPKQEKPQVEKNKSRAADKMQASEPSLLCGYLSILDKKGNWTKRWIAVRSDFAMYLYKKHQDVKTSDTLPLPGYEISVAGKTDKVDRSNVFKLCHKQMGVSYFHAENEEVMKVWVRVLEKLVKLEMPSDEDLENKRLSGHSLESSNSASSEQS